MNGAEFQNYISLGAMLLMASCVALVLITLSFLCGPRNPNPHKEQPYECGIEEIVPTPKRFPVKFLQVAMLFLIFDVEAISLYPAVSIMKTAAAQGMGLYVLGTVGGFLALIVLGFLYEWKKGAFEWI